MLRFRSTPTIRESASDAARSAQLARVELSEIADSVHLVATAVTICLVMATAAYVVSVLFDD